MGKITAELSEMKTFYVFRQLCCDKSETSLWETQEPITISILSRLQPDIVQFVSQILGFSDLNISQMGLFQIPTWKCLGTVNMIDKSLDS